MTCVSELIECARNYNETAMHTALPRNNHTWHFPAQQPLPLGEIHPNKVGLHLQQRHGAGSSIHSKSALLCGVAGHLVTDTDLPSALGSRYPSRNRDCRVDGRCPCHNAGCRGRGGPCMGHTSQKPASQPRRYAETCCRAHVPCAGQPVGVEQLPALVDQRPRQPGVGEGRRAVHHALEVWPARAHAGERSTPQRPRRPSP